MKTTNGAVRFEPDFLEHEVQRLRDECLRLLGELEGRYQRVAHVPQAMKARYERLRASLHSLEQAIVRALRGRGRALLVGAAVAGVALVVTLSLVGRERRRGLPERILGLLG
jgi:hypothetical protein